jgi:solute:Na+ symporter, SSS family
MPHKLDTFSLAALLVGANYGLGFILGTAENALTQGAAGSLYAVSTGFGLLALAGLARFYWREEKPIWTLLDDRYGGQLKTLISFMSWSWMVGVVAAQILGGAFILKCLGMSLQSGMLAMAVLFMTISLLPVQKVGQLFKTLLIVNSGIILYSLVKLKGLFNYLQAPLSFIQDLHHIPIGQQIGVVLTTICLIPIGMQFQVFIVQTRDSKHAIRGCILAGIITLFLSFVPSAVTLTARASGVLPEGIAGKEIIPFIFSWLGGGSHQPLGIVLMLALLGSALGSGSGLVRAMNKTIGELDVFPQPQKNCLAIAIVNTLIGLGIAFIGGSIISLMVAFYALYVSAVLIPFLAYLLSGTKKIDFTPMSIKLSVICGGISAIAVLVTTFIRPDSALWNSQQLSILVIGMGFSLLGLLLGKAIDNPSYILIRTDR